MRRRVVVTGIGCVTPAGHRDRDRVAAAAGRRVGRRLHHAVRRQQLPHQDRGRGPRLGRLRRGRGPRRLEVPGPAHPVRRRRRQEGRRRLGRPRHGRSIRPRFGVYPGSGEGQQDFDRFTADDGRRPGRTASSTWPSSPRRAWRSLNPIAELEQEPNMPAGHLASLFNAQGPNVNCLTACAASSQAIGEAAEIIRRGEADVMLSGGTHSMIHPFGVTGFNLLTALSTRNDEPTRASRPFDRDRDGFVLGEGAGMVVLEELERAKARGAQIYGEIVGYGSTADAFRITDTHPEGRGAISCMQDGPGRRRPEPRRDRLHQRPRHQHQRQRQGRDAGHQAGLRRAGLQDSRLQHQEHDGPPDRRRRRDRADHLPAGDPRQRRCRRRSTTKRPIPTATWTTSPTTPASTRATSP